MNIFFNRQSAHSDASLFRQTSNTFSSGTLTHRRSDFQTCANPFPRAEATTPRSCFPKAIGSFPSAYVCARRSHSHHRRSNKDMLSAFGNSSCLSDLLMYLTERKPEGGGVREGGGISLKITAAVKCKMCSKLISVTKCHSVCD